MSIQAMKHVLDVATKRVKADLVIKGGSIVDVFSHTIFISDIAISHGIIAGIGSYEGIEEYDARGTYILPGFIDGHVHIESSMLDPAAFSSLVLPYGTTTVIADPHEICNVCGIDGLDYMIEASENLPLSIFFMIPSCVPATPFEHSGAHIDAQAIASRIDHPRILGLGELMNMVGAVSGDHDILEKIEVARTAGKVIDGHAPSLDGYDLHAYASLGIHTDHECATEEDLNQRIARGMYVLLREGSACHDVRNLLGGVTVHNNRRCLFCTDDRQPRSIYEEGHIDNHLRIAVQQGLDPIDAIKMATLNASECYQLHDRGAIVPGRRADLVVVSDLTSFTVTDVFSLGNRFVEHSEMSKLDPRVVGSIHIGSVSEKDLRLPLFSNHVRVIDIIAGSVVTRSGEAFLNSVEHGMFSYDPTQDIVKIAVIERHRGTNFVGLALIRGYGIQKGAIATTIAHDSHNIIVIGVDDQQMMRAVEHVVALGGGIVLVKDGVVLDALELPIGGLMTNKGGAYVDQKISFMHEAAQKELHVHPDIDPFMTLSFMALPVIPSLKVTDRGLFDVDTFSFVPIEID